VASLVNLFLSSSTRFNVFRSDSKSKPLTDFVLGSTVTGLGSTTGCISNSIGVGTESDSLAGTLVDLVTGGGLTFR